MNSDIKIEAFNRLNALHQADRIDNGDYSVSRSWAGAWASAGMRSGIGLTAGTAGASAICCTLTVSTGRKG